MALSLFDMLRKDHFGMNPFIVPVLPISPIFVNSLFDILKTANFDSTSLSVSATKNGLDYRVTGPNISYSPRGIYANIRLVILLSPIIQLELVKSESSRPETAPNV